MDVSSKVNSKRESCMATAFMSGKTDVSMRVITSSTKNMVKEPTFIQTEVDIQVSGLKDNSMVLAASLMLSAPRREKASGRTARSSNGFKTNSEAN